ncbi:MAG: sugar transferase [Planctomycetota bacterium]|jgi:lipopolysaccharide/colanic/teichoic acid biosynthesis glycosyltransferase
MKLILVPQNDDSLSKRNSALLKFAYTAPVVSNVVFDGLTKSSCPSFEANTLVTIPKHWIKNTDTHATRLITYHNAIKINPDDVENKKWSVISNGRFATTMDERFLHQVLDTTDCDILAMTADPSLLARREKMLLTAKGSIAGCRRQYCDGLEAAPVPLNWPHHLFIKSNVLKSIGCDSTISDSFGDFLQNCRNRKLSIKSVRIAANILDLASQNGLLLFIKLSLDEQKDEYFSSGNLLSNTTNNGNKISKTARLQGEVILGNGTTIDDDAVIAGPAIISENVTIKRGTVINASVIGANISLPAESVISNQVIISQADVANNPAPMSTVDAKSTISSISGRQFRRRPVFRDWPKFSYAGRFKRIFDCLIAAFVLIMFAPVLPIIALLIKLDSSGPIFFKDERQGLHGRVFACLKFRTMETGSDQLQDTIRTANVLDGPQFKIPDDPRVTAVGRFLRETCIDEIPQFFNVILGQMSVVGPRPSPTAENTTCPPWRDARLSVKPGITGLWQICRTRMPMRDFQEWIFFDIKYVKDLSFKTDLWICWKTAIHLIKKFFTQF